MFLNRLYALMIQAGYFLLSLLLFENSRAYGWDAWSISFNKLSHLFLVLKVRTCDPKFRFFPGTGCRLNCTLRTELNGLDKLITQRLPRLLTRGVNLDLRLNNLLVYNG